MISNFQYLCCNEQI